MTGDGNGIPPSAVLGEEALLVKVRADRLEGRTIAFANGCFDVLHVGHVRYLTGSAAQADRLIVAVNGDASVKQLKGHGRPVHVAADRAELIAALAVVDYVVVFHDLTVHRLLSILKPEVHCKGPDYTIDTVPERDVVRAYGGRTVIIPGNKDHSTRNLVAQVRAIENG